VHGFIGTYRAVLANVATDMNVAINLIGGRDMHPLPLCFWSESDTVECPLPYTCTAWGSTNCIVMMRGQVNCLSASTTWRLACMLSP